MCNFGNGMTRGLMSGFCIVLGAAAQTPEWHHAQQLYQQTEYVQSLAVLAGISSKGVDEFQLIGQCYLMQGSYKLAGEAFEKALALEPRSSELHRLLGTVYGRRAETGSVFTAAGNAHKAKQYLERAVELDPANREAVANLFEYYLEAPGFMGGGLDKAESLIARIVRLDTSAGHLAFAQLEGKRRRYDAEEDQLRRAAALAPTQVGRMIDLATFLSDRGRVKDSDEIFDETARIFPDSSELLFSRAETYIAQRRNLKAARQLLERYLSSPLTPGDPPRERARTLLGKTGN
jgi:tetratricopeptide (TPR) repeat protein